VYVFVCVYEGEVRESKDSETWSIGIRSPVHQLAAVYKLMPK
jgi:hypothetical protein